MQSKSCKTQLFYHSDNYPLSLYHTASNNNGCYNKINKFSQPCGRWFYDSRNTMVAVVYRIELNGVNSDIDAIQPEEKI